MKRGLKKNNLGDYGEKPMLFFDPGKSVIDELFAGIRRVARGTVKTVKLSIAILLFLMLIGCSALPGMTETAPAILSTVEPTLTQEPTSAATPTLEIAQPSISHRLRPENAATQTLENGTWVVKNADGLVTATWNSQLQEWTYNMEAITIQRAVIGFEGQDESILEPLFAPLPADTPENHFIDPKSNEPLPYGYYGENIKQMSSSPLEKTVDYPTSVFLVRNLGVVQVNEDLYAIGHELPVSVDRSIVLIQWGGITDYRITVNPAYFDDPTDVLGTILNLKGEFFSIEKRIQFLQDFRGHQVVILMLHGVSQEICEAHTNYCQASGNGDQNLQYIQNPTGPIPDVPFPSQDEYGFIAMDPYLKFVVGVPESAIMESPHFK